MKLLGGFLTSIAYLFTYSFLGLIFLFVTKLIIGVEEGYLWLTRFLLVFLFLAAAKQVPYVHGWKTLMVGHPPQPMLKSKFVYLGLFKGSINSVLDTLAFCLLSLYWFFFFAPDSPLSPEALFVGGTLVLVMVFGISPTVSNGLSQKFTQKI